MSIYFDPTKRNDYDKKKSKRCKHGILLLFNRIKKFLKKKRNELKLIIEFIAESF